jgi:head-tail adaptor
MTQPKYGRSSALSTLRERIILERNEQTLDEAGGMAASWIEAATLWAGLQLYGPPKLQTTNGLSTTQILWQIRIRRRRDVAPGMRFSKAVANQQRETYYYIVSVLDDIFQRSFLSCICEERQ